MQQGRVCRTSFFILKMFQEWRHEWNDVLCILNVTYLSKIEMLFSEVMFRHSKDLTKDKSPCYDDTSSVDDPSSLESLNDRQKIDLKILDALSAVLLSANEDSVQAPLKTWAAKLLVWFRKFFDQWLSIISIIASVIELFEHFFRTVHALQSPFSIHLIYIISKSVLDPFILLYFNKYFKFSLKM